MRGYAISLAAEYSAELTFLYVAANAPRTGEGGRRSLPSVHKNSINWFSETERQNLNVRSAVWLGKPYEEIVRHATEVQAGLIIMTARGGDAVDRAVFGSTTYRVIQFGPCPVLAIHT